MWDNPILGIIVCFIHQNGTDRVSRVNKTQQPSVSEIEWSHSIPDKKTQNFISNNYFYMLWGISSL